MGLPRVVVRPLFDVRVSGLEHWPGAAVPDRGQPSQRLRPAPRHRHRPGRAAHHVVRSTRGGLQPRIQEQGHGVLRRDDSLQPREDDPHQRRARRRRVFEADGVLGHLRRGPHRLSRDGAPAIRGGCGGVRGDRPPCRSCRAPIVGSTDLWFRKRIEVRFGPPIPTTDVRGREGRADLEARIRAGVEALLPDAEPRLPRRRPMALLTNLLNGSEDVARRTAGEAPGR